jgi:hypothetical protein
MVLPVWALALFDMAGEFVSTKNAVDIFATEPTWAYCECFAGVFGLLTLSHALRQPVVYGVAIHLQLWIALVLVVFAMQVGSVEARFLDNMWWADSTVMLWYGRVPLHAVLYKASSVYVAWHAAMRMSAGLVPKDATVVVAGIVNVMLNLPFDMMASKYLWRTYHDSDTNLQDRTFGVPTILLVCEWALACGSLVLFEFVCELRFSGKSSAAFLVCQLEHASFLDVMAHPPSPPPPHA